MNRSQAKKRLTEFLGDDVLTFTIKQYDGDKWTAQCDQVDGIITGGEGYDAETIENLMRDAILAAADVPVEYADLLKRKLTNPPEVPEEVRSQYQDAVLLPLQSSYIVQNHDSTVG